MVTGRDLQLIDSLSSVPVCCVEGGGFSPLQLALGTPLNDLCRTKIINAHFFTCKKMCIYYFCQKSELTLQINSYNLCRRICL
ncbi:unnamed protein product, partial [Staurois parvus]